MSLPVFAGGFHYEIDVTTTFESNDENQLESLYMSWVFDKQSSELLLEGGDLSTPEIRQLTLNSLARGILKDLEKYKYLTNLEAGISRIKTAKVQEHQIQLHNGQIALSFRLPLKSPYSMVGNKRLTLFHEDPNGTALLIYTGTEKIIFDGLLKARCQTTFAEKDFYIHGESSQLLNITCH
jgi:ABC-type uncharacterized transport system substrate-binding protein